MVDLGPASPDFSVWRYCRAADVMRLLCRLWYFSMFFKLCLASELNEEAGRMSGEKSRGPVSHSVVVRKAS